MNVALGNKEYSKFLMVIFSNKVEGFWETINLKETRLMDKSYFSV